MATVVRVAGGVKRALQGGRGVGGCHTILTALGEKLHFGLLFSIGFH